MIGTITYILARAGWRAMNGQLTDERRRLAGAEAPAAYVSYDPRLLAGVDWYGYRIAFKGGDRQMIERARYMLSERYVIRDGYEYYADGVYVFGVLLRQRVPHYGIGGGAPTPEPDALNFYMPNGGTISLNKTGSPTVVELEYSLDRGATWTVWQEDENGNRSLTLSVGQRTYIRNTSETSTSFTMDTSNCYRFVFTDTVYGNGCIDSLICKDIQNAVITEFCFYALFSHCSTLITAPYISSKDPANYSYRALFSYCDNLTNCTINVTTIASGCFYRMLRDCSSLKTITIRVSDYSDTSFNGWLVNASTNGDFYCPAELTIPTGTSGIPSGWTRHDI